MAMIKVGPEGGRGGSFWDEEGQDQVAGILVSYDLNRVYSLQFIFYEEDGNLDLSAKHGIHQRENFSAIMFNYPSEFLTSISGSYERVIKKTYVLNSIKFGTNKGSYGPFGYVPSSTDAAADDDNVCIKDFSFQLGNYRCFGGLHGSKNSYGVESIGFYVKSVPSSSMVSSKDPRVKAEKEED